MTNPANDGSLIGRLTQDVKAFTNSDGSKKLLITIAADDNFVSGPDRKAQTNFIQLETFVAEGASTRGWDRVRKGDLIAAKYHVDSKPYRDQGGVMHYPQKLVADGAPKFLEPKSVTDRRAAENAVKATQNAEAPASDRIAQMEAEIAALRGQSENVDYTETAPFGG